MKELTNEMKAKYFSLYIGQDVIVENNISLHPMKLIGFDNVNVCQVRDEAIKLTFYMNVEDCYALLKPLSAISDEDAIEVARIANSTSFLNERIKWEVDIDMEFGFKTISAKGSYHSFDFDTADGMIAMYCGDDKSDIALNHYGVIDFLRSRGYALPFMQCSVSDLIQAGWLQLKSTETIR